MSEEGEQKKEKKQDLARTPVMGQVTSPLPRVTIQFCTQCKWMLRAAYYAQELLSTFNLTLGEVALQPSTGGTFVVTITTTTSDAVPPSSDGTTTTSSKTLWDRKVDGGFPETKELKRRVRDVVEPGRDLGHVDRDHKQVGAAREKAAIPTAGAAVGSGSECLETVQTNDCEDCK